MKQHISLSSLPSRGEYYFDPNHLLHIPLYTLSDVLNYNSYPIHNYIHQLLRDIETLGIENSDDILLYDLTAISFLKKCMSIKEDINFDFNFKCSECEKEFLQSIKLTDIDFKVGLSLPEKITINNDELYIKIPTLKDVRNVIKLFLGYKKLPSYEIFLLCCYLDFSSNPNRIKYLVENAKQSDIVKLLNMIDNLDPLLPNSINCTSCNKESVVKLSALTTDLFSLFRINYRGNPE